MTREKQLELLELLKQWDSEEMDCQGDCHECYYNMSSSEYYLDNCPFIVACDMVYRKVYYPELWNKRKG